ncbi:hypothetical protein BGZ61DRAFT_540186 [Ilyonectria robusta]|uniref:uncharacterized protein n=1 Tax=Ilyonectria robusta TaxID=1079257 RepID=UPI001E8CB725|nr:uncharacterized protein BGZ61DRAFT_540186 [Ilyonectria robusta]KAH8659628.1 hypothetical protein BGZ61DRAFT_540186 [Ilyonectria robusta]
MSSDDASPSKRPCPDPDATPTKPRATGPMGKSAPSDGLGDGSSNASSRSSSKRSRSSPTKGLAFLRIEHIIVHRSFRGQKAPPPALKEIVWHIKQDAFGMDIFSPSDIDVIRATANPIFDELLDTPRLVDLTGKREELGKLPDIDTILNIWEEAQDCELDGHSEASWNCAVHYPLLNAALRLAKVNQPDVQKQVQIKAFNVTTAQVPRPYATYTANTSYNKRIDFCISIKPERESPLSDALYRVAQQSAHLSVNHTDYTPLINSPISLSIETKRTGQDWEAALQQVSTWMAGHWKRLRELAQESGAEGLEFLPGIIIQGHDWMFIAATQGRVLDGNDRETIIWSKIPIGSTDGIQGICQIITVLQRLATWSAQSHWPWFQRTVLGSGDT